VLIRASLRLQAIPDAIPIILVEESCQVFWGRMLNIYTWHHDKSIATLSNTVKEICILAAG
jgi:hypothetical protein